MRKPTISLRAISSEEQTFSPTKKHINPPEAKQIAQKEDTGDVFAFGSMLRWLMIIGMIVAIVIFFGGQLLNYSNSD